MSSILDEMKVSQTLSRGAIRVSIGKENTEEEMILAAERLWDAFRDVCLR